MTTKLYPVLFEVPDKTDTTDPKRRTAALSQLARKALQMSAGRSGLELECLEKGGKGQPLPEKGVYWSLTHKTDWVGAVADRQPVGIDIERVKPVRAGMYAKVATKNDWDFLGRATEMNFYYLWTAKEAVVKAEGVGFAGFSHCRVGGPIKNGTLQMIYGEREYTITFKYFEGHIVAITSPSERVNWQIVMHDLDNR